MSSLGRARGYLQVEKVMRTRVLMLRRRTATGRYAVRIERPVQTMQMEIDGMLKEGQRLTIDWKGCYYHYLHIIHYLLTKTIFLGFDLQSTLLACWILAHIYLAVVKDHQYKSQF